MTAHAPHGGIDAYRGMLAALGLQHAVIVQSGGHGGTRCVARDALVASNGAWRGIAQVDPQVEQDELVALHSAGFRDVRFDCLSVGGLDLGALEAVARKIAPFGWHVELLVNARELDALLPLLRRLPVPLVIDPMGAMPAGAGVRHPGFRTLLKLVRRRSAWCKLSGAGRMGHPAQPRSAAAAFARALVDAAADRLVWGTRWPHGQETGTLPDDAGLFNLLAD